MIFLQIILLIIGFTLLVKGADAFVDGCSSLAKAFGIPSLIIGLTIVAFGTSAPELAVSLVAAFKGNSAISVGNVVGSNICNMLLVLGGASLFGTLHCKKKVVERDYFYLLISYFALLIISFGTFNLKTEAGIINRVDGLLLLCFLGVYVYSLIMDTKKEIKKQEKTKERITFKKILFIIIGLIAIIGGGELVVNSATGIAKIIGLSDSVIALTIVAVGTSLPELVTSVVAVKKGESDLAIGNVIGSNIFNIFLILGLSATVNSLTISFSSLIDMLVMLGAGLLVYGFTLKDQKVTKQRGLVLLVFYFSYVGYLLVR